MTVEATAPKPTEEMTDDELIAAAALESANAGPVEDEPVIEETPASKPVFRREIDLGDGSGKQVFEADTMEGLVDALSQAQTHATKKIRELSREQKVEKAGEAEAQERELTADEEWLLSQEFINHPSKTQKKLIEGLLGMPVSEFRAKMKRVEEFDWLQRANAAADEFVAKHAEDYYVCPSNKSRIAAYMETYDLEPTVANLEKAFSDLTASGLLEQKPKEAASAEESHNEEQESTRIAETSQPKPVTPTRKAGSGIVTKGRSAPVVKTGQPTEADLYEMPLEKLEQLANEQLRAGR